MELRKKVLNLGFWSAIAVAIFTIGFIVALPLTFSANLVEWTGISGPLCLFGVVVPVIMPLAGTLWFICLTSGMVKIAIYFRKLILLDKKLDTE